MQSLQRIKSLHCCSTNNVANEINGPQGPWMKSKSDFWKQISFAAILPSRPILFFTFMETWLWKTRMRFVEKNLHRMVSEFAKKYISTTMAKFNFGHFRQEFLYTPVSGLFLRVVSPQNDSEPQILCVEVYTYRYVLEFSTSSFLFLGNGTPASSSAAAVGILAGNLLH